MIQEKIKLLTEKLVYFDEVKITMSNEEFIAFNTTFNNFNTLTMNRWKKYAREVGLKIYAFSLFSIDNLQLRITLRLTK